MPWARIDDTILDNPKVAGLTMGQFGTYVALIVYSARWLLDGRIPSHIVGNPRQSRSAIADIRVCEALAKRGLIGQEGDEWVIHDYLDYNPSKADVQAEREATAERVRAYRARRSNGVTNGVTPKPVTALVTGPRTRTRLNPTVQEDSPAAVGSEAAIAGPAPAVQRAMSKWIRADILESLSASDYQLVAQAIDADSQQVRQSMALVEGASRPRAYLVKIARNIVSTTT